MPKYVAVMPYSCKNKCKQIATNNSIANNEFKSIPQGWNETIHVKHLNSTLEGVVPKPYKQEQDRHRSSDDDITIQMKIHSIFSKNVLIGI